MNIIKKITGILLLLFAALLAMATFLSIFNAIGESIKAIEKSGVTGIGYTVGSFLVIGLMIVLIIFIMKLGLKLIKKKIINHNPFEKIGT